MDIEHKKTALDDDAYLYQKKDTVSKEDLKKLSKKQKFQYFKDYYLKALILIIIIAIAAINILYTTVFKRSECVLSIAALNGAQIEASEELKEDLRDYLEIENKNDYVNVEQFYLDDYQMNMAFVARMAAGSGDIIVCNYEDFQDQAARGAFVDLSDFLPEDLYSQLSGRILNGAVTELDSEGNVTSTGPEQPFGIDISDSTALKKYNPTEEIVLCVSAGTEHSENIQKVIRYFTDSDLAE